MGARFRKSFKLFPGARVNLSKGGVSVSFGGPGATLNVSKRGIRGTVGMPGTGLSASQLVQFESGGSSTPATLPHAAPSHWQPGTWGASVEHFKSGPTASLTSESLASLRELLCTADAQKTDAIRASEVGRADVSRLEREKYWKSFFPIAWMFKGRLAEVQEQLSAKEEELQDLAAWVEVSGAPLDFDLDGVIGEAYTALVAAFEKAAACDAIWDVMTEQEVDKRERSAASTTIERERVSLDFGKSPWVAFEGRSMILGNRNGQPLVIYPGFLLVDGGKSQGPALISFDDLQVRFGISRFLEEDHLPSDAIVLDQTWAKVNKDGSRDKRFSGNYQIPIVAYGRMSFITNSGLREQYQFSSAVTGLQLALTLRALQLAIRGDGSFERLADDIAAAGTTDEPLSAMMSLVSKEYPKSRRGHQGPRSAVNEARPANANGPRKAPSPRDAVAVALSYVALADGKVDAKERSRIRDLLAAVFGEGERVSEAPHAYDGDNIDLKALQEAVRTIEAAGLEPEQVFALGCALLGSKRGAVRQERLRDLQHALSVSDEHVDSCWALAKAKYS